MATLMSQLEVMKAQLTLMEEKEEQTEIEIEALKRQCEKKDRKINYLIDECANTLEDSKRAKKGKEKEDADANKMKDLQDQIEEMAREITTLIEEKEQWEANFQLQEQQEEILQERLIEKQIEITHWEKLANDRLESLAKAGQNEEWLRKKIEKLTSECQELKAEVERLKREDKDFVNEWDTMIKYHQNEKNEWIKRCEDMTECVREKIAELSKHLNGAMEELLIDQLPLKTYRLLRYCENLTRSIG